MHCVAAVAATQTFALRAQAPQPSTRHEKDNQNNTGKLNQQGSRKRFAKQRFFGKRRRNGAKRAGCESKPPKSEVYGDEGTAARSRPRWTACHNEKQNSEKLSSLILVFYWGWVWGRLGNILHGGENFHAVVFERLLMYRRFVLVAGKSV